MREMSDNRKSIDLSTLTFSKLPLRYGTESCFITVTDSLYTAEIVRLRNTPVLGKYINYVELTEESHERWLAGQLERDDALNFALVARQKFTGILSLYNIKHGESCEFGRMMMPDDGRRIFALAAEMLGMSFAFEILGTRTLYCVVMEGNNAVLKFHLRNGWRLDARYERFELVNGSNARLIGLSMDRSEWPQCFARMRPLARRLLAPAQVGTL
jgi:RimJ/RimL family protein N-acetyltransferase